MVRSLLLALLGGMLVFAAPAAAEEPEPGADTTPPIIANGLLSPSTLSYEGGNFQISVDLIDETELNSTYAQVFGSDGSYQSIYLYQGNGSTYYGTLEAAPNYSDNTATYLVEVQAYDAFHNYNSAYIGEVQVEGRPQFDETPWVTMATLNPPVLPSSGGPVTISAQAGDDHGLSAVFASITPVSGGASTEVGLNWVGNGSFEGIWEASARRTARGTGYPARLP